MTMTTQAEAAKPAPAKRSLFKRPKWAATNTTEPKDSATKPKNEDFFSRSNETFAAFAKEEEEREKRRLSKRAAKQQVKSPPPTDDSQKPSPKRRRLSRESESDDDDGGEHLSDIEAERAEEEAARARAAAEAEAAATKKEFTDLLDKGKAFVKDGMAQLGIEEDTAPPPSPSKLPSDAPRIPNDKQCDDIRAKQPRLAGYDNSFIRELALRKWEREREGQVVSPGPSSPSRQLRSSGRPGPTLRSSEMAIRRSPSNLNGAGADKPEVIQLDDDNDEEPAEDRSKSAATAMPEAKAECASPAGPTTEDDPELMEMEQRARENARRKRLLAEPVLTPSPSSAAATPASETTDSLVRASVAPPPEEDPVVQLLVTSDIPGTRGLIINRKISQRLKEVREYWCSSNQLAPEVRSKVRLHWKNRRLYDSQNCRKLGFAAGPDGSVVYTKPGGEYDDYDGKIHLIAMAEGMSSAGPDAPANETTGAGDESEQATQQSQVEEYRIIMRNPNYPECKIIVKSTTLISRMIGAFKKHGNVPADKTIAMMFDGELLQPNSTVGQTDIDDMDHIDVYVR